MSDRFDHLDLLLVGFTGGMLLATLAKDCWAAPHIQQEPERASEQTCAPVVSERVDEALAIERARCVLQVASAESVAFDAGFFVGSLGCEDRDR